MKRVIVLLVLFLCAGLLFAGGKSDKAASDGSRHLRWLSNSGTDNYITGMKEIAANFAKTHPGFSFEIEPAPDQAARSQKIKILAASDEYYDWFSTDRDPFMQGLAKKGAIVDVKKLLTELGKADALYDIAYKFNAFDDGSLYFFSFCSVMEYFWYHPSHFAKAGINAQDIRTFKDLVAALEKLKKAGYQALGMSSAEWYVQRWDGFIPFRLSGNGFIDQLKYNKANMSDAVGLEAAQWLASLRPYLASGWAADDGSAMLSNFLAGNSSVIYYGTWDPTNFILPDGSLKPDVAHFMLPVLGDGRDKTLPSDAWANSGTGIAFATKHMDALHKEFINYVIEQMPANSVKYLYLPAVKPTAAQLASFPKGFQDILNDILAVKQFGTCWDINVDPATYEALGKGTVSLMLGDITPGQFCKLVDDAVDNNAEKYWAAAGVQ